MLATRLSYALIFFALSFCLLATSATFSQQQVAHVDIGNNAVIWNPLTADKMLLTVSGPGGDFRFDLEAGEKAAFEVFHHDGSPLRDGSYTWQLTALPSISDATRAAIQKARAEGVAFDGSLPQGLTQSGAFQVQDGFFVVPVQETPNKPAELAEPNKDLIADDLVVQGKLCAGDDCDSAQSFGFDTLRLKENNVRILLQDTSNSASFPNNDWQLTANDTSNGGANRFSIEDVEDPQNVLIPFTIEAGAPSHALYVDDLGRVGSGTSTPAKEIHLVDGDSPTVRLEQDGSGGLTAQTWDMVGNEAHWSVRDITGSTQPFKIVPAAPNDSLFIDADGDVGVGTASPSASLHVSGDDGTTQISIEEGNTIPNYVGGMLEIDSAATSGVVSAVNIFTAGARPRFTMTHGGVPATWNWDILNTTGNFALIQAGGPTFTFGSQTGNLEIDGNFVAYGYHLNVPDYVFADDYDLMPLDEVQAFIDEKQHLPEVPSAANVKAEGLDMTNMQMTLLKKVEELTLYTLDLHATNRDQEETIRSQQDTIQQLIERVEVLESAQE